MVAISYLEQEFKKCSVTEIGMWLRKLQNTVQMILLINNNKSNSRQQEELGLLGHAELPTKAPFYSLEYAAVLGSLRAQAGEHNALR